MVFAPALIALNSPARASCLSGVMAQPVKAIAVMIEKMLNAFLVFIVVSEVAIGEVKSVDKYD